MICALREADLVRACVDAIRAAKHRTQSTRTCTGRSSSIVLADPAGFAVDWNWQRHLTVWALAGRPYEPEFDSKVLEHELPVQPTSERQAQAAAGSWWWAHGRTQALAALRESASQLGR